MGTRVDRTPNRMAMRWEMLQGDRAKPSLMLIAVLKKADRRSEHRKRPPKNVAIRISVILVWMMLFESIPNTLFTALFAALNIPFAPKRIPTRAIAPNANAPLIRLRRASLMRSEDAGK